MASGQTASGQAAVVSNVSTFSVVFMVAVALVLALVFVVPISALLIAAFKQNKNTFGVIAVYVVAGILVLLPVVLAILYFRARRSLQKSEAARKK